MRASESLTDLFASWSGSKLTRQEFDRLAGQRLELIRKFSRHLSENLLVIRLGELKESVRRSESGKASGTSPDLTLQEIPTALDEIAQKARTVKKRLEELIQPASRRGPGEAEQGPNRSTVTVGELRAPKIRDLCKQIRAAAKRVSTSLRALDAPP